MEDRTAEEDLSARLEDVQRRTLEHPGYREKELFDGLARTMYAVLIPNRDELLGLLQRAADDVNLAIELFQNVRRPAVRTWFEGAVMRALHNYVASAAALVDHARRIMRTREGPIVEEFARRKHGVVGHPEITFVQGLRNFVLHRSLPFIGHDVQLHPRPGVVATSQIKLSVAELLAWDKWSSAARTFISSYEGGLELRPVIERHAKLTLELNEWLYQELTSANRGALAEVNELVVERNAILAGTSLEEARRITEEWTKRRESPTG